MWPHCRKKPPTTQEIGGWRAAASNPRHFSIQNPSSDLQYRTRTFRVIHPCFSNPHTRPALSQQRRKTISDADTLKHTHARARGRPGSAHGRLRSVVLRRAGHRKRQRCDRRGRGICVLPWPRSYDLSRRWVAIPDNPAGHEPIGHLAREPRQQPVGNGRLTPCPRPGHATLVAPSAKRWRLPQPFASQTQNPQRTHTHHAGPPASNSLKSTTMRADLGDDLHFPHSDTAPAPTPARPVVIAGPQRSALSSGQLSQQLGGGGGGGGCVLGRLPMGSLPVRMISAPAASMVRASLGVIGGVCAGGGLGDQQCQSLATACSSQLPIHCSLHINSAEPVKATAPRPCPVPPHPTFHPPSPPLSRAPLSPSPSPTSPAGPTPQTPPPPPPPPPPTASRLCRRTA